MSVAADALPEKSDKVHLSFSKLSKLAKCPQEFYLRYINKDPAREIISGAGLGGTAVHKVIAVSEAEGWWKDAQMYAVDDPQAPLTETFSTTFAEIVTQEGGPESPRIRWGGRKSKAFPYGETFLWWMQMGPSFLRRYATVRRRDEEQGSTILEGSVEFEVGADIGEEHITGWVDAALLVNADGQRVVRDWKTGTWLDPWQLATYGFLVARARGWEVTVGEFGYLRGSKPEDWIKTYDLSPWLPLVEGRYADLARQIRVHEDAQVWPWNPSNLCPSCGQRPRCPWGSTLGE